MKKYKIGLITLAASLFTLVASLFASSACFWGFYQPEEPKSLRK